MSSPHGERGANLPAHTVPEWLRRRAYLTPDVAALVSSGTTWTFRELDEVAQQEAVRLYREGVSKGDHVALLGQNSPGYIVALCVLMRLGAVAVPLNTRLQPPEIAWQVTDAQVKLILVDPVHEELARAALAEGAKAAVSQGCSRSDALGPKLVFLDPNPAKPSAGTLSGASCAGGRTASGNGGGAAGKGSGETVSDAVGCSDGSDSYDASPGQTVTRESLSLDEVQGIIYTSGTTGRPKGAMLTYGNHWWNAIGSGINLGGHEGDVWLAAVPLFHVSGLSIVMRALIHGFTILLHQRFDPAAANRAIDHEGVTLISVVSVMLDRMLQERGDRPYPPTLRAALVGGGPVPEPLLRKALDLGMPVLQTYGMTETASQAATLSPRDALRKLGSAGKPLFHVDIRVDAPQGQIGEIQVRGPSVSPGYYRRPEESLAARQNGWLRTGDLGYFDDEGYLYVVDRRTDLIISGGENVYPAEVESVLHSHPAVLEAGVAPKSDPRWGQVPVAFVVPQDRPGPELAEALIEHCRRHLAGYKVPVEVRFVSELPRNAAGKVARHRLAALIASPAAAADAGNEPKHG